MDAKTKNKIECNRKIVGENDMRIAYQSTVRGVSRRENEKLGKYNDFVYRGIVFSIPQEDFPEKLHEYDFPFETFIKEFDECIPMPGGIIERHEIFDVNTGDVHVMYRVPYVVKPGATPELPQ